MFFFIMQRLWKCDIWIAEFRGFYRTDIPNFMHLIIYREYKQFCVNDKISDLVKFLYHLI